MLAPNQNQVGWPPDYTAVFAWRQARSLKMREDKVLAYCAKQYYSTRPAEFIEHWCDTYDPRNAGGKLPTTLPFVLFPRQRQLLDFLLSCLNEDANGLVEKCRDMGATWLCCAFSIWLWLFWPGVSIGWGSRKEQLVDHIGDLDSIFEKMRMIVRRLPPAFLPVGLNPDEHMTYMRFINPENEASITGEAGDNIGRGGRKRIYFKDESSFYERPEKIEAALTDNTLVQMDLSSVNGFGTVFHRRRDAGVVWLPGKKAVKGFTNVFVMDWHDHPMKTQEWYDRRRASAERDGLLHLFAREVDRDYSASIEGIIIPAIWVRSAVDAHIKLKIDDSGAWAAALDVADGGTDKNALAKRKGIVLRYADVWGARDVGVTTRNTINECKPHAPIDIQYDCIGVGSGVKAEANRLAGEGLMPKGLRLVSWDAGSGPLDPDKRVVEGDKESPLNKDFYGNLKAQGWWKLRQRFEKTHRAVTQGIKFNPEELISLDSKLPRLLELEKELSQPTKGQSGRLKLIVNKQPDGMRSPNMGDAVMMLYHPVKAQSSYTLDHVR